ncbi:type II toxin-antitoxin system RelE/ParE family toxin [Cyclobacterium salsum]|uniref:type II toxin-antitoxin system RelE/ParE family toxin n=1 Tax=Cyclobacterium salsum TaxID=2666329 RepID=UPI001390E43B|nr:type II toxin-antitoxin system RelE/ParE family toxin [Cyclobacterium salsum]
MGHYRLTEDAKADLIRIHHYGVLRFGENQAEKYFMAFFDQFDLIADQPYLFPSVDFIREGYRRSVCRADSIYFRIESNAVEIMAIIGRQDFDEDSI